MNAVSQKGAVRAVSGVINAGLMAVTVPFVEVLEKYVRKPSLSINNVQKILPALDTYHRLTRLIEHLVSWMRGLRPYARRRSRWEANKPPRG